MTSSSTPRRRSILLGGAATAAATTGLTGCGSTDSAPARPGGGAGTFGGAIAQTAQVPVAGAVYVADHQVIVTQPTAGTFKAFSSACPHQGCAVSKVEGAVLQCPCHGSEFDLQGQVTKGPATTGLTPEAVTVRGDSILKS